MSGFSGHLTKRTQDVPIVEMSRDEIGYHTAQDISHGDNYRMSPTQSFGYLTRTFAGTGVRDCAHNVMQQ